MPDRAGRSNDIPADIELFERQGQTEAAPLDNRLFSRPIVVKRPEIAAPPCFFPRICQLRDNVLELLNIDRANRLDIYAHLTTTAHSQDHRFTGVREVKIRAAGDERSPPLRLANRLQGKPPGTAVRQAQCSAKEHPAQQRSLPILPALQPKYRLLLERRQFSKKCCLQLHGQRFAEVHKRDMDLVAVAISLIRNRQRTKRRAIVLNLPLFCHYRLLATTRRPLFADR